MAETAEKKGPVARIEQTTEPLAPKVREPGAARYVIHVDVTLPRLKGHAVRATLSSGKRLKLYPPGIVVGSGKNIEWLTEAEARELQETPGITLVQLAPFGQDVPAPLAPASATEQLERNRTGVEGFATARYAFEGPDEP